MASHPPLISSHPVDSRKDFVWVHYAVWVKSILDQLHDTDHLGTLRVGQVWWIEDTHSMLSSDATFTLSYEVHHMWIDDIVESFHQIFILVTREANIDMQVPISNVSVAHSHYAFFLSSCQLR